MHFGWMKFDMYYKTILFYFFYWNKQVHILIFVKFICSDNYIQIMKKDKHNIFIYFGHADSSFVNIFNGKNMLAISHLISKIIRVDMKN